MDHNFLSFILFCVFVVFCPSLYKINDHHLHMPSTSTFSSSMHSSTINYCFSSLYHGNTQSVLSQKHQSRSNMIIKVHLHPGSDLKVHIFSLYCIFVCSISASFEIMFALAIRSLNFRMRASKNQPGLFQDQVFFDHIHTWFSYSNDQSSISAMKMRTMRPMCTTSKSVGHCFF